MVVVIGSGAGGATVARELSKAGIDVKILEKGPYISPKKAYKCYEKDDKVLRTSCVGGTTLVSMGNALRTLEDELLKYGIDLSNEFRELEKELSISPLPDSHFGKGTKMLMDAAKSLNLPVKKMPKFIDPNKCEPCGKCPFGCPKDAKWTSLNYINESLKYGAKLYSNTVVKKILVKNDEVCGVLTNKGKIKDKNVVVAAGAIETAKLLKKVGIKAGEKFFMDTFITVGGILKSINFHKEVQMNMFIEMDKYILSPHFSTLLRDKLKCKNKDIIGIMVKIKDDSCGKIKNKKIIKYHTENDIEALCDGSVLATSLLEKIGVSPNTIVSTIPRGAHPGGTAPIGEVVDNNLQTKISGLYVADASVLPESPGAPPILTIMALAKRLSKYLLNSLR